jgi:hypothetical protein
MAFPSGRAKAWARRTESGDRTPLNSQSEVEDRKNDVGRLKGTPADGILAARRPDRDFGTSRFKGSYTQAT